MSKFAVRVPVAGPVTTLTEQPDTVTFEGAPAYARDVKSELFLLAATNMSGEDTFYEGGSERDARFRSLIHAATVEDALWVARFVPYLRDQMHMRSASIVMAAESAKARLNHTIDVKPSIREMVSSAIQRTDECTEMLAYWTGRYGKNFPAGVKRGVADAMTRLTTDYTAMKYDGVGRAWRLGDVVELTHPQPSSAAQSVLFQYLLDRRHHPKDVRADLTELPMILANVALNAMPSDERRVWLDEGDRSTAFRVAGMTWEQMSGWLGGPMDARAWEAVIPSMGYMALLRNLRNFDEVGVSDAVANTVSARLSNPQQVALSRQLPFRFLSAYLAAPSLRWGYALERALTLSTANLPSLPGRSLILIDTSGSMTSGKISARSSITPAAGAALFGIALGARCSGVDVFGFADGAFRHELPAGGSVLKDVEAFVGRSGEVGHGTNIPLALNQWDGHDRIFLFSDMQSGLFGGYGSIPRLRKDVPLYAFNLCGYESTYVPSGTPGVHEFGGLSDKTFEMIAMLEKGRNADWPF